MVNNVSISESIYAGLLDALFVVFLVLKLTDTITWSWWYVTMPIWIRIVPMLVSLFIGLSLLIIVVNGMALYQYIMKLFRR